MADAPLIRPRAVVPGEQVYCLGLPNPNPTRIGSWATLPVGREWGSTPGLDIDPTDLARSAMRAPRSRSMLWPVCSFSVE